MIPRSRFPLIPILGILALGPGADCASRLDQTRQLFLDDAIIESADNIRRIVHSARKYSGNPVLRLDERRFRIGSVILDEGRFRMWYVCGRGICYAESRDGIVWTKPEFNIVCIDGKPTHVLLQGRSEEDGARPGPNPEFPFLTALFGVHKDERDPDPSRRYKMGFLNIAYHYSGPKEDVYHPGERRGLGVAGSPDGIHWRLIDNWATNAICDGQTHWMWDKAHRKFVLYGRTKFISASVAEAWGFMGVPSVAMPAETHRWLKESFWGRAVARVESDDFIKWDITEPGKAPVVMTADMLDQPGTEIYAMSVFPYESSYVGLVKVWRRTPLGGPLEVQLAVSRDTVGFTRVGDRAPFIPVGGVGEWDRFNHSLPTNPPIAIGDELRFYYSGSSSRHPPYRGQDTGHGGGIGFATIPRDRFVSLAASFDGGTILTKPLTLAGGRLFLNAKADFGEILVEALGPDGAVAGVSKPVRRDALEIAVEWDRIDAAILRAPVRLRLTLRNAHLFAIWCR